MADLDEKSDNSESKYTHVLPGVYGFLHLLCCFGGFCIHLNLDDQYIFYYLYQFKNIY